MLDLIIASDNGQSSIGGWLVAFGIVAVPYVLWCIVTRRKKVEINER